MASESMLFCLIVSTVLCIAAGSLAFSDQQDGGGSGNDNATEFCISRRRCHTFMRCCESHCGQRNFTATCSNSNGRQCVCGRPGARSPSNPRILDGQLCGRQAVEPSLDTNRGNDSARPHSWPWQVSLELRGQHHCGGALIDSRHVLTGATCFRTSNDPKNFKIILGLHNRRSRSDPDILSVGVKTITVHENTSQSSYSNDIAIVQLDTPVRYSENITPVCLPSTEATAGAQCIATGWGETPNHGNTGRPSETLSQVLVPIVLNKTCNSEHYNGAVDRTMLCAGGNGRDLCAGAAGGPLVCPRSNSTWEIQGIISWGIGCGQMPGVYARVYHFKEWIKQYLN